MDTSAFVALAVARDAHHKRAAAFLKGLPSSASLVTTEFVFDETITRLRKVAGHETALAVGRALRTSTLASVGRVEPEDIERAWALFEQYDDKALSFTDCTSFAFCERVGLKSAFTFDDDFAMAGFAVEP